MADDINKKNDQQSQSGRQGGGTQDQGHTGQQKDKGADNTAQKRPTQVGHDEDIDEQDEQEKAGQRRAS